MSPIDLVPDFVPVLGWGDDIMAILVDIGAVLFALYEWKMRQQLDEEPVRQLN